MSSKKTIPNVDDNTPERPGRISKNLLTPCRQVGLSRKRKTPGSTQVSPWATGEVVGNNNTCIPPSRDSTSEPAITSTSNKLDTPKRDSIIEKSSSKLQKSKATGSKKNTTSLPIEPPVSSLDSHKSITKATSSKKVVIANSTSFETSEASQDSLLPLDNPRSKSKTTEEVNTTKRSSLKRQITNKSTVFETGESSDDSFSPLKHESNNVRTSKSSKTNKTSGRAAKKIRIIDTSESDEDSDWQPQSISSKSKTIKIVSSKESNSPSNLSNVSVKISRLRVYKEDGDSSTASQHASSSNVISRKVTEEKLIENCEKKPRKQCKVNKIEGGITQNKGNVDIKENVCAVQETIMGVKNNVLSNKSPCEKKCTPATSKRVRKALSMKKTYSDDDSIEYDGNINTECLSSKTKSNTVDDDLECFHINNIISQKSDSKIEHINILDNSDDFISTPDEDKLGKDQLVQQINQLEECIKTKKDRLSHLKQTEVYQRLHNADDLKKLFLAWKKGCIQALNDLLPHLASHSEIDMPTLLKNLRIPPEFISISPQQQLI